VQTLIANVINKGNDIYNALDANAKKDPVKVKRATDAQSGAQPLAGPQSALAAKKATYHDLSLTAHCMKLVISADPTGPTTEGAVVTRTEGTRPGLVERRRTTQFAADRGSVCLDIVRLSDISWKLESLRGRAPPGSSA
jgi:hypothetical protein